VNLGDDFSLDLKVVPKLEYTGDRSSVGWAFERSKEVR